MILNATVIMELEIEMLRIDDFDYATYSSILLGIGDILWLAHDIASRGFNGHYAVIGAVFLMGNLGLVIGLRKHHTATRRIKICHKQ